MLGKEGGDTDASDVRPISVSIQVSQNHQYFQRGNYLVINIQGSELGNRRVYWKAKGKESFCLGRNLIQV